MHTGVIICLQVDCWTSRRGSTHSRWAGDVGLNASAWWSAYHSTEILVTVLWRGFHARTTVSVMCEQAQSLESRWLRKQRWYTLWPGDSNRLQSIRLSDIFEYILFFMATKRGLLYKNSQFFDQYVSISNRDLGRRFSLLSTFVKSLQEDYVMVGLIMLYWLGRNSDGVIRKKGFVNFRSVHHFFMTFELVEILTGSVICMRGVLLKKSRFSTKISLYLRNDSR